MALMPTVAAPGDDARQFFERERYKALRLLWRRSSLKAVRNCHHHSVMPNGQVKVLVTPTPSGPRVGFSGLATCASPWSCPVCANKIATQRAEDIANAVRRWEQMGGRVAMVTLTMRHKRGQKLVDLWDGLSWGWAAVLKNDWNLDQEKYGTQVHRMITHGKRKGEWVTENRIGWVRAVEATHGVNGWHLHIHSLLFLKGEPDLDALSKSMFQRWRERLVGLGLSAPIASRGGLDARWIEGGEEAISEYVTKSTYDGALRAGFEVARGGQKQAGGTTPFGMLANVCDNLDNADDPLLQLRAEADLARWWEWEKASKRRRQVTWCRWLRDLVQLDEEMTDEDIASEDVTTVDTVAHAHYDNQQWAVLRRDIPAVKRAAEVWYEAEFLPTLEAFPPWLEQWRLSWFKERLSKS